MKESDIRYGDILFKDTDFKDKGKNIFMKAVNWATSKLQGVDDKDHTEIFHWDNGVLSVSSATKKQGVRTMSFENWKKNEGYPAIEILRSPDKMTPSEKRVMRRMIAEDRGMPYGLANDLRARISINDENLVRKEGMICSETTSKWIGNSDWMGDWPVELYNKQVAKGWFSAFKGECIDL